MDIEEEGCDIDVAIYSGMLCHSDLVSKLYEICWIQYVFLLAKDGVGYLIPLLMWPCLVFACIVENLVYSLVKLGRVMAGIM